MKRVRMKVNGMTKEFDNLADAIDWSNEVLARDGATEVVAITVPSWLKHELREVKRRAGVPMAAQVRAFYLKGASGR